MYRNYWDYIQRQTKHSIVSGSAVPTHKDHTVAYDGVYSNMNIKDCFILNKLRPCA